jgi:hypothetical protein
MTESLAEKDPNLFMRVMRERDLTLSPEERQIPASDQFPKVYGLLMEWQNGPAIFTMSVTGAGEANLYTTAGFGLLGKNANSAALQNGARYFVEAAQQFHDVAKPVNEFPYPSSESSNSTPKRFRRRLPPLVCYWAAARMFRRRCKCS